MYKAMIKTSLVALATVATVSSTFAMDTISEFYTNDQVNLADVISDININIDSVENLAKIEGSAIGNNIAVQALEDVQSVNAEFSQRSETDNIISRITMDIHSADVVNITSEALANKAHIVNKNTAGHNVINGTQFSAAAPPPPAMPAPAPGGGDPLSDVSVTMASVDKINIDSTAGGNLAQFVLGGTNNIVNMAQSNSVLNQSLVDVNIGNITDSISLSSKAFGNSNITILGNPAD